MCPNVKAHFFFQSVPIQLSRLCRHPSIRTLVSDIRRCKVGVLVQ